MAQRVDFLEKAIGDSADKHSKELNSLRESHAKHCQALEGMRSLHTLKDDLKELSSWQEEIRSRLASCEKLGTTFLELKRSHADLVGSKNMMTAEHSNLRDRVDNLECMFADSTNRNVKEMESIKGSHAKHEASISRHALHLETVMTSLNSSSSLEERVSHIEKNLGDALDAHGNELSE